MRSKTSTPSMSSSSATSRTANRRSVTLMILRPLKISEVGEELVDEDGGRCIERLPRRGVLVDSAKAGIDCQQHLSGLLQRQDDLIRQRIAVWHLLSLLSRSNVRKLEHVAGRLSFRPPQ